MESPVRGIRFIHEAINREAADLEERAKAGHSIRPVYHREEEELLAQLDGPDYLRAATRLAEHPIRAIG